MTDTTAVELVATAFENLEPLTMNSTLMHMSQVVRLACSLAVKTCHGLDDDFVAGRAHKHCVDDAVGLTPWMVGAIRASCLNEVRRLRFRGER